MYLPYVEIIQHVLYMSNFKLFQHIENMLNAVNLEKYILIYARMGKIH